MKPSIILQVILASAVLFLAVNYFIGTSHDKKAFDDLTLLAEEEEDSEDFFDKRDYIIDMYYRTKFKVFITRTFIFSGLLGVAFYVIVTRDNLKSKEVGALLQGKTMFEERVPTIKPPLPEQQEFMEPVATAEEPVPEKRKNIRHMYFNVAPF